MVKFSTDHTIQIECVFSEATEMLNLSIGSYLKMNCTFYQNADDELCCKTTKSDGDFKSGVKIKAKFHTIPGL